MALKTAGCLPYEEIYTNPQVFSIAFAHIVFLLQNMTDASHLWVIFCLIVPFVGY